MILYNTDYGEFRAKAHANHIDLGHVLLEFLCNKRYLPVSIVFIQNERIEVHPGERETHSNHTLQTAHLGDIISERRLKNESPRI